MGHPDEREPTPEQWQDFLEQHEASEDSPDLDDPANRLHFEELHELVREAAREAWNRGDHAAAVDAAWTALRDEIQRRTRRPDLDGIDLINQGIGETAPRLPLTDHVSETDQNMHRGLVYFLRGAVYYVRNPEKHESISPVEGDREGALERLAVMSLCARHVVKAAAPTAIEDAIKELAQPKFPQRRQAFDNLLQRVPVRRHPEFLSNVLAGAVSAHAEGNERVYGTFTMMYRHILDRSPDASIASASALEMDPLIADDSTLEVGMRLLTAKAARLLEERNRWKVHEAILEEVRSQEFGPATPGGLFEDIPRLVSGMNAPPRKEILDALADALVDPSATRQLWAYATLIRFADTLTVEERAPLVSVLARIAHADANGFIAKSLRDPGHNSPVFRGEVAAAIEELSPPSDDLSSFLDDVDADIKFD